MSLLTSLPEAHGPAMGLTGLWAWMVGSPVNLALWIGNRLATWTGLFVVWRKLKGAPDRTKRFLLWGMALNAVSLFLLLGVLRLLAAR